jgi:glycosyltransferase involved in cell wall biosynthesis
MKIAFFSPAWPHGQNGIITYVRNVSLAMHEQGHEISVLTFDARGTIGHERVVPVSLSGGPGAFAALVYRIRRKVRSRPDAWDRPARVLARELRKLKQTRGVDVFEMEETFGLCGVVADSVDVPVVARLHGPYFLNGVFESAGGNLDQHQLRREGEAIGKVSAVTSPSRQVVEATREYYGLQREMLVIPNPVPALPGAPVWSLAGSEPDTILFVGRTDSRKGGDLVLHVFERLLRSRPGLRLHFVGPDRGFADSGPGVGWTEYLASHLAPATRQQITYHGPLQPDEVANLRIRCRVTLVFSRYENHPLVCAEALAAGCPLVATNVGGIPEIVEHERTGLLADIDDLDDMTGQVERLLADPEFGARLGAAGRRFCFDHLQPSVVASRTVDVYRRVLAGNSSVS